MEIPSGSDCNIASEHCHGNSEFSRGFTGDVLVIYLLVSSNMAGWKIPELNGGFELGKSLINILRLKYLLLTIDDHFRRFKMP